MDGTSFDTLTRQLIATRSRRAAVRAVAAGLVVGGLGWRGEAALATPCTLNPNGDRCTSNGQCCSGHCVRKKGTHKRFCRKAPGQGICTVTENQCSGGSIACNSLGTPQCVCWVSESGFSFCGALPADLLDHCFICNSDADCQERPGAQAGDRCVYCAISCTDQPTGNSNGTACISKCPNPA
jgi:hypothetical protein